MRSVVVVLLTFLSSACGPTMLCGSANCMGCCESATGRCLSGADVSWCGIGGSTCKTCTSTEACVRGGCESKVRACSSATCSGCCDSNGLCVSGQLASACGSGGMSCGVCLATQTCVSVTGGAAGGACQ